ncbi:MAG: carbohydrate ABC transporter permease, partial [Planctomycetes bacterium]|nr:carbohydrate ABC transporter permease [Planctomycetota bacterium]
MTVYRAKRLLTRAFVFAILLVIACLFVLPFVWLLFTSFKSNQEIYHTPITIFPNQVVLTQYFYIVKQLPQFFVYLKNSVIVSTTVVVLTLILSATCGYALGRKSFRGSGLIMAAIVIMMSLPWAIYLIPIYVIAAQLRLLNTRLVLVIYYAGLSLPLGIFMMRG